MPVRPKPEAAQAGKRVTRRPEGAACLLHVAYTGLPLCAARPGARSPATPLFLELSAAAPWLRGLPSGHSLPDGAAPGRWRAASPPARRAGPGPRGAGRVGAPRRLTKTPAGAKPGVAPARAGPGAGQAARGRRVALSLTKWRGPAAILCGSGKTKAAARGQGARGRRRPSTQEAARAEGAGSGRGPGRALSRTFSCLSSRSPGRRGPIALGWPPEWMPHGVWVLIGLRSGQPLTKWPEGPSCLLGTPRHSHPEIQAGTSCLSGAGERRHGQLPRNTPGVRGHSSPTSSSTETPPDPSTAAHNSPSLLWRLKTPVLLA